VRHAVESIGATRVSMDSLGTVIAQFGDSSASRQQLRWLSGELRGLGVTVVMTVERPDDSGPVARLGVEEFVADNVVIFRNLLEEEKRRRTVEVLKLRGTNDRKGEYPFTVLPGAGIRVIPLFSIELASRSSDTRVTSGNEQLDEMCGGGLFKDSITLVSGATGTGKTLTTAEFLAGGLRSREKCVLLAFEESGDQMFRNARGWGCARATHDKQIREFHIDGEGMHIGRPFRRSAVPCGRRHPRRYVDEPRRQRGRPDLGASPRLTRSPRCRRCSWSRGAQLRSSSNQTRFPPATWSAPHRVDSVSSSHTPRPPSSTSGSACLVCGSVALPSTTSARTRCPCPTSRSLVGVPACRTELVTSSLTSSTDVSATSS
jgi:KaiC/GvpD/RAD55 family RecA-like ATPase